MKLPNVIFICSVNSDIGYGHLSRSLSLIDEFIKWKFPVRLILCNSSRVSIRKDVSTLYIYNSDLEVELGQIFESVNLKNSICVVDRKNADYDYLACLKKNTLYLVDINGEYKGQNPADLIVRGDVGEKTVGKKLGGPRYKLLGSNFRPEMNRFCRKKKVIISFGGSDPSGFSEIIDNYLTGDPKFDFKLIIGDGYKARERLNGSKVDIVFGEKNLGRWFSGAHAAVLSCGITVYEAFACGIPCLVVSQNRLQREEGRYLMKKDLIRMTDKYNLITDVKRFIHDDNTLLELRDNIKGLVDLRGAERIVEKVNGVIHGELISV